MATSPGRRQANAKAQRTYVAGLETSGLSKTTVIMPKDYKKAIDIYAATGGIKKQDAWLNIIETGMKTLGIPYKKSV
jgi:hypothetical protein